MNTKTLSRINRFGHIGKIIMTILLIVSIVVALLTLTATIVVASKPKDSVKIAVSEQAEFKMNDSLFPIMWNFLAENASYSGKEAPTELTDGYSDNILPAENTEINANLTFFNRSFSSAKITSHGSDKIINAKSSVSEYGLSDFLTLLIFATVFSLFVVVAVFMLQKLFQSLSICESPFCVDFVKKLRSFGFSLLPVALFGSVGETLAVRLFSFGQSKCVNIQWGLLIAFAVTMCLVTVFRYGVLLQKESDETL